MGFGDLKSKAGQQALDKFLEERSYIEGFQPSQADVVVFNAMSGAPVADLCNALRWYNHIKSYGSEKSGCIFSSYPVVYFQDGGKRPKKRSKNFSPTEIAVLKDACIENVRILDAKHCSGATAITKKMQDDCWRSICVRVNASGVSTRSVGEVREKWRNMIKKAKTSFTNERVEMQRTGGGPAPVDMSPVSADIVSLYVKHDSFAGIAGAGDCETTIMSYPAQNDQKCPTATSGPSETSSYTQNDQKCPTATSGPSETSSYRLSELGEGSADHDAETEQILHRAIMNAIGPLPGSTQNDPVAIPSCSTRPQQACSSDSGIEGHMSLPGVGKPLTSYGPAGDAGKAADDDDNDMDDLFGSSDEEEEEKEDEAKKARLAAYHAKKAKKPQVIAKSSLLLDVKPWDDETDMAEMERLVRTITMDGLLWGQAKLVPVGYGIRKLQINAVIEDDKVSTDDLEDGITAFEDLVQSMDIAAFNKI